MRPEHWLYTIPLRLRSLFRWAQADQELDDELRDHLERKTEEYVAKGLTPQAARRLARLDLGGIEQTKEKCRDARGVNFVETFLQDLRYGLRMLRKSPGFTAVAILTLTLGIAANATIFSWIHSVLLNPLPGAGEPERVFALESVTPGGDWVPTSYLDYRDTRDYTKLFDAFSVSYPMTVAVGNDRTVEQLRAELVSGSFFDLLRVRPEAGRFFIAENEDTQNAHPVVVISHGFWVSHYQRDPSAIGSTIRVNRHLYTIIGVAPDGFYGSMPGFAFQMWPLAGRSRGVRGRG